MFPFFLNCESENDVYVLVKRPNLGCRVLVQRNVSKIAKGLANELKSWLVDIRIRCSQLLCAIVLHAEENITQCLQDILPAMYDAARNEDKTVTTNVIWFLK